MLTLIRGIPGSGKSTLARKLAGDLVNARWLEADHFFINPDTGVYAWDGAKIGQAHSWCQEETANALYYKQDVFVSNTFTTEKEIRPYLEILRLMTGVKLNIITCQGSFGSIHGVPDATLAAMKKRFVYNLEPLLAEFGF